MKLDITTLAERPHLREAIGRFAESWPAFMTQDIIADVFWGAIYDTFSEYVLVATHDGEAVARALSVPFALHAEGRGELPPDGWDQVLVWAFADHKRGVTPDTVSAIEINIDPPHQGKGLSGRMLAAMRDNARERGFSEVVAPVRPNAKHHEPATPMSEYAFRVRDDGLPVDPWLRVHVRAGAEIVKVAPTSMTITGSLDEWRQWTGQPFDKDGPVKVDGALVPIEARVSHNYAVYVEPNVWMRHPL
ncbi:MAG: N-acetyltransferase [Micromonosporaceae bacterium]|nr:N-acetyltransferase [Micromonosporaceae bacterium]